MLDNLRMISHSKESGEEEILHMKEVFSGYRSSHISSNHETYIEEHPLVDLLTSLAPPSLWSLVGGSKKRDEKLKVVIIRGKVDGVWKSLKEGCAALLKSYFKERQEDEAAVMECMEYATSLIVYFDNPNAGGITSTTNLTVISLINFTQVPLSRHCYINWVITSFDVFDRKNGGDGKCFQNRGLTSLLFQLLWSVVDGTQNLCNDSSTCLFLQCQHFEAESSPLHFYSSRGFSLLVDHLPYGHDDDMFESLPNGLQECIVHKNTSKEDYTYCHFLHLDDLENDCTHPLHVLTCSSQPLVPWIYHSITVTDLEDQLCRTYLSSEIFTNEHNEMCTWTERETQIVHEMMGHIKKLEQFMPLYEVSNEDRKEYNRQFHSKTFQCPLHMREGFIPKLMTMPYSHVCGGLVNVRSSEVTFPCRKVGVFSKHLSCFSAAIDGADCDGGDNSHADGYGCCLHWVLLRYVTIMSRFKAGDKKFYFVSEIHRNHGLLDDDNESISSKVDSNCEDNSMNNHAENDAKSVATSHKEGHCNDSFDLLDDDSSDEKTSLNNTCEQPALNRLRRFNGRQVLGNVRKKLRACATDEETIDTRLSLEESQDFRTTEFFTALWVGYKTERIEKDGVSLSMEEMKEECLNLRMCGVLPLQVLSGKDLEKKTSHFQFIAEDHHDARWKKWKQLLRRAFKTTRKKLTHSKKSFKATPEGNHVVVGLSYSPADDIFAVGSFTVHLSNGEKIAVSLSAVADFFSASVVYTAVNRCLSGDYIDPDEQGDGRFSIIHQTYKFQDKEITMMKAYFHKRMGEYGFKGLVEGQNQPYDLPSFWAELNFNPWYLQDLIDRVKEGKHRGFVDVPPGEAKHEEEPTCPYYLQAPRIHYWQGNNQFCAFYAVASALHAAGYPKAAARVALAAEVDSGTVNVIKKLNKCVQANVKHLLPKSIPNAPKFDIFGEESLNNMYPRILVLKGKEDGSRNHAIAMIGGWVFDANWVTAKWVTQEILNWCVSGSAHNITYGGIVCGYTYQENPSTRVENRHYEKPAFLCGMDIY